MADPLRQLGQILKDLGALKESGLQAALAEQRRSGGRLGSILVARGAIEQADLARALAEQRGLDWIEGSDLSPDPEAVALLDAPTARAFGALPLSVEGGQLLLALADPDNLPLLGDLESMTGLPLRPVLTEPHLLQEVVERVYAARAEEQAAQVAEEAEAAPIVRLLDSILTRAVRDNAADVHFEPYQGEFRVRLRVDGVLYEIDPPPAHLATAIISRVKVLANLDISETRMPQDGRIELTVDGYQVDLRVSTVPTQGGESVVLRILDRRSLRLDMAELGLAENEKSAVREFAALPHGIVLVTGPTGSGKTTTLYSLLSSINDPERKILTVEDPVEYDLDGVIQVPIHDEIGVSYASVLRTMLRQDPDVILVGEIRDPETAQIAVEAALTGHLVFSTLHTNDAPSTITRMVDLGIEPFLLAATLEGVVAQRLVRRICLHCREPQELSAEWIDRAEITETEGWFHGAGCDACHFTGYSGRVAIYEILPVDDPVREQFLADPSMIALRNLAEQRGVQSLRTRGLAVAREGVTTLEEVLRETQGPGI